MKKIRIIQVVLVGLIPLSISSCTPLSPKVDVEDAERGAPVRDLPQIDKSSDLEQYRYNNRHRNRYRDDYSRSTI